MMWAYIEFENYLIRQKCMEGAFIFYLTDLVNIWISEWTQEAITRKFRDLNPLFDMKDDAIMTKVRNFYNDANGVVHHVDKNSESLTLLSTDTMNRFSMKMEMIFHPTGPETLFFELYQNIFSCMNQLLLREKQLIDIIQAKDAEIEEYRLEGIEIKRRAAITTPFNQEEFENNQKEVEPLLNPSTLFKGPLGDLLGRLTKNFSVKSENKEEETEEQVKRKVTKSGLEKLSGFESRGVLYKKDNHEETSVSKKRHKKILKL